MGEAHLIVSITKGFRTEGLSSLPRTSPLCPFPQHQEKSQDFNIQEAGNGFLFFF